MTVQRVSRAIDGSDGPALITASVASACCVRRRDEDERLGKKHPAVVHMAAWVEAQYRQGPTTAIASEEMRELVHEHLPENANRRSGPLSATIPA